MVQIELKTFLRLSFDPPFAEGLGMTSVMTSPAFDDETLSLPISGADCFFRPGESVTRTRDLRGIRADR